MKDSYNIFGNETKEDMLNETIYVFDDQKIDCNEDEIIFKPDEDDDESFDWHEDEEFIDIFHTSQIWNIPPLEYKDNNSSCIHININMPRTHAAFQQAFSKWSERKNKENEVSRNQSKKVILPFLDFSESCSIGRHKEENSLVYSESSGMERGGTEDIKENNYDKFIQHFRLVFLMDLYKILFNIILPVIHFAITARALFAAMVSHHSNYTHEYNNNKQNYYKETMTVSWKMNIIDFKEVLTHDDREHYYLVKWKENAFNIKEILTQNDGKDFRTSLISKLKIWNCASHTHNDGECHIRVFNLMKYLVHF
jgi:hypothetical protein